MYELETINMDVDDFINIPGNPIQRDTRIHAEKAKKYHLSSEAATHQKVAIAKMGKIQWKLDGHTRAHLWVEGELTAPSVVSVDVYTVDTKQEAIELYKQFDNRDAMETNADKIAGALQFMGIKNYGLFFVRNTGILSGIATIDMAMKRHSPRADVVQKMMKWKPELRALINQHWTSNNKGNMPGTPACVIAAFLVTNRMYQNDCLGFWDGYYNGTGSETLKSGRCGCQAAIDYIHKVRKDDMMMGSHNRARHTEALIRAYLIYRSKKPVTKLSQLYKRDHNKSSAAQLGDFLIDIGFK